MESQKEKLMRILECSEEEAQDIIRYDSLVDAGKATEYQLTSEQEKASKRARSVSKSPTVYKFDTAQRKRKENPTKRGIIANLAEFLATLDLENISIENPERVIAFSVGEDSFELTLTQKRKKKQALGSIGAPQAGTPNFVQNDD